MRKETKQENPDREADAKVVRQNLIRNLEEKMHKAAKARRRAWEDRDDACERHYQGAWNAYIDATWTVAEAILPPDEFEALRARWERAGQPPILDRAPATEGKE